MASTRCSTSDRHVRVGSPTVPGEGEFRRDWSNEAFFTGPEPSGLRTGQNTFLVGMVWWFGNKSGAW